MLVGGSCLHFVSSLPSSRSYAQDTITSFLLDAGHFYLVDGTLHVVPPQRAIERAESSGSQPCQGRATVHGSIRSRAEDRSNSGMVLSTKVLSVKLLDYPMRSTRRKECYTKSCEMLAAVYCSMERALQVIGEDGLD